MRAWELYPSLATDLGEEQALEISRHLWGHGYDRYAYFTGNPVWITPGEIAEATRRTSGAIDIDPCSNPVANREVIKAARFFCEADNKLAHDWPGKAYVNAPYAHPIVEDFAYHLIDQYMREITCEAIWLSNASTSNEWWRDLARRGVVCHAGCLRFGKIDGDRVTYPRRRSQFEQSIIYLATAATAFCEEFYEIGMVMEKVVDASDDGD